MKKILALLSFASSLVFSMGGASLVEVSSLKKGEVNPLQKFIGTVEFDDNSLLGAKNSGSVKKINVEVGDRVKKGEVLVEIDSDLLNAKIDAIKANLEIAKDEEKNSLKDYERYKKLLKSKSITQKEYDDTLLRYNLSKSKLQGINSNLKELIIQKDHKLIKAPFSGIVSLKEVSLGEWVNAGSPTVKVLNTKTAFITFNVPHEFIFALKRGDVYNINVGGKNIKAKLKAAIPNGDKRTRTFPVKFKANIESGFVFQNQEAEVKLSKKGKIKAFLLPRDSVIRKFNQNVIFTINKENLAVMMPVQIVGYEGNLVAINAKGLSEGMKIVSKGNERIFPNSPVKIINK